MRVAGRGGCCGLLKAGCVRCPAGTLTECGWVARAEWVSMAEGDGLGGEGRDCDDPRADSDSGGRGGGEAGAKCVRGERAHFVKRRMPVRLGACAAAASRRDVSSNHRPAGA